MEKCYEFESHNQYLEVMKAVAQITGLDPWDFKVYYHNDGEFEGCIEVVLGKTVHVTFYGYVLDIKSTGSFNMTTVGLITKISDNIDKIWEAYRKAS